MQSIYALHQDEHYNLQKEEQFLVESMQNMHGLYATLMGLIRQLHTRGEELLKISKNKYFVNEEETIFNQKIVENKVLTKIVSDEALNDLIEHKGLINWQQHDEYVDIIYREILKSSVFQRYLTKNKTNDWVADRFLIMDLYREVIAENEKLFDFLQDSLISFVDDFPIVNTLIVKILKGFSEEAPSDYFTPKLFKNQDDEIFGIDLLRKAVLNDEKYQKYLKEKITKDWDIDRIALLDTILIKMAIAEFLAFPSIPVRVTINEYLEIAKEYCLPTSTSFINGVLDRLSKELEEKGLIQKIGRGLR